jgi:hypothetical protein
LHWNFQFCCNWLVFCSWNFNWINVIFSYSLFHFYIWALILELTRFKIACETG